MKFWFQKYYPLLIILTVGAILRINLLFVRGTFWFDEMFSVHFSQLPWKETVRYWIIETNPPFYTVFLRGWLALTGNQNEIMVRLPSLFFALATIILFFLLAQKIFNRQIAILSSLFLTLSSIHIFISTETRAYSLLALLTVASFNLFYDIFFLNKNNNLRWIAYFLINLLLLYSHLTALFIPLIQLLSLLVLPEIKWKQKKWWQAHLAIGVLWLIWFVPSIAFKINSDSATAWYFSPEANGSANIFTLLVSIFMTNELNYLIFTLSAFVLTAIIIFIIKKIIKEPLEPNTKKIIMLALWGLFPILAGTLLGVFITKFYIIPALGLYLLVAYSLNQFPQNKKYKIAITTFCILLIAPSALSVSQTTIFSWRNFLSYVEKNETNHSLTMVMPFNETLVINRYYQGHQPVLGVYLKEDQLPFAERVVRYNWNRQVTDKEKLTAWLEKKLQGVDKLFYLQYTDEYSWIHQILLEKGWKITNYVVSDSYININLFEFHAPVKTLAK